MEWRPIETCTEKENGFRALLLVDGKAIEGWWNDQYPLSKFPEHLGAVRRWEPVAVFAGFMWRNGREPLPTHWMPLPELPIEVKLSEDQRYLLGFLAKESMGYGPSWGAALDGLREMGLVRFDPPIDRPARDECLVLITDAGRSLASA